MSGGLCEACKKLVDELFSIELSDGSHDVCKACFSRWEDGEYDDD